MSPLVFTVVLFLPDIMLDPTELPPPLVQEYEVSLIPSWKVCRDMREWAEDNVKYLEEKSRLGGYIQTTYRPYLDDAYWRKQVWTTAAQVRWHPSDCVDSLMHLEILRHLVGPETYYSGNLPLPINIELLRID